MEPFIQEIRAFEAEHSWWTPETFLRLENKALKEAIWNAFDNHLTFTQKMIQETTAEDMAEFEASLQEKAPKMYIATLACFLNLLHTAAMADNTISHQAVSWFRQKGWQFPEFPHEEAS